MNCYYDEEDYTENEMDYYYNEDSRNHIVVNQTSNNIGNIIA